LICRGAAERAEYCRQKRDEGWHQVAPFGKRGELSTVISRTELAEFTK
jgi:hypothetical protein